MSGQAVWYLQMRKMNGDFKILLPIVAYIPSAYSFLVHGRNALLCPFEVESNHLMSSSQEIVGEVKGVTAQPEHSVEAVRPQLQWLWKYVLKKSLCQQGLYLSDKDEQRSPSNPCLTNSMRKKKNAVLRLWDFWSRYCILTQPVLTVTFINK